MRRRERRVKRLHAEPADVLAEPLRRHEGDRAEAADVAVVEAPAVGEGERDADELLLALGERRRSVVGEEGASEARLHDEPVARREVEDDELRATPRALDARAAHSARP